MILGVIILLMVEFRSCLSVMWWVVTCHVTRDMTSQNTGIHHRRQMARFGVIMVNITFTLHGAIAHGKSENSAISALWNPGTPIQLWHHAIDITQFKSRRNKPKSERKKAKSGRKIVKSERKGANPGKH